jgi:4'-phosphopantetheinyl transferase
MTKAWLWMADVEAVTEADLLRYRDWLSASEVARYQRFARAQRLRQFVVGRILVRKALGALLRVAPRDIHLEEQVAKAPLLVSPAVKGGMPGFSIAHSGRWVACAVSAQTALGLDIEMRDAGRDLTALAAQAFDEREMARWERAQYQSEQQRIDGFYRMWSEKEARFKMGATTPADGHCVVVPHAELSVVVCSELPLDSAPVIEVVNLG